MGAAEAVSVVPDDDDVVHEGDVEQGECVPDLFGGGHVGV